MKMETECKCNCDEAVTGVWSNNSMQMGAFTLVGYLLYRFSQTLPALIRWPIRIFCSLTGLSALWGWVSRLVGTIRAFQTLFKWMSRIWRFMLALPSKFRWLLAVSQTVINFFKHLESVFTHNKHPTSSSSLSPPTSDPSRDTGLRLILLGPSGGGRTSLARTLLGSSAAQTRMPAGPLMESTKLKMLEGDREVTVIDTPDLLGSSLGGCKRALEALRSIQLSSPGPHAFLLVIRAPGSSLAVDQDVTQAVQATLELFGVEVRGHIVPVLTHGDRLPPSRSEHQLLEEDAGGLRAALTLCGQRPELVDNRPDCPPEVQALVRGQVLGRVAEVETLRGHFVHQLQKREDDIKQELLTDMASALSRQLGHM